MDSFNRHGTRLINNNRREISQTKLKKKKDLKVINLRVALPISLAESLLSLSASIHPWFWSFSNKFVRGNLSRSLKSRRIWLLLCIENHSPLRSYFHTVFPVRIGILQIRWWVRSNCKSTWKRVQWKGRYWFVAFMVLVRC